MQDGDGERVPKARPVHEIGCDLSNLSVDELGERVALLEAEVARLRADEVRKRASRDAAASVFRT